MEKDWREATAEIARAAKAAHAAMTAGGFTWDFAGEGKRTPTETEIALTYVELLQEIREDGGYDSVTTGRLWVHNFAGSLDLGIELN